MTDQAMAVQAEEVQQETSTRKTREKAVKKYRIYFHPQGEDKSDVVIVHNYVQNVYQRGVWTEIDENFLSVVKDAVLETEHKMRDQVTGEDKTRKISQPSLQYSVEQV